MRKKMRERERERKKDEVKRAKRARALVRGTELERAREEKISVW